ncbi:sugar-binding protein [Actinomadura opuntiae]|uniref:sugar-binding protein n=1 Tax=Actinomadura sp. OS1-43 TaxID=604315 RepID=UPI00255B057E|nr:sugar-binding protein [Actinomadura sp. OS1-43]MDL4821681.1 sugar-binding protein [Actinomadura sp. OS1-43]
MRRLALPAVLSAALAGSAIALAGPPAQARTAPSDRTAPSERGRLDVLFVGAHPDDESGTLSTLGQWNEFDKARTGVLTVTRGEGGGNAAGTEEGPALGLLREDEERRAVGKAGVTDVHNLDKVDFYYTVSAPLTEDTWGHDDTLAKVVRIVRETRPKVIVTMNPAPLPGQHGNHQEAARLATEAYRAAADPNAFPTQLSKEGLKTWAPGRLFQGGGASGPTGQECAAKLTPSTPASVAYGVWGGRTSARNGGKTWAQVEREAQRLYVSQGWAGFPDAPSDPSKIGCDYFTQIASRVPFTLGNTDPSAPLEGAVTPVKGGLPLGTQFSLTTGSYGVTPGAAFTVTAHASAPKKLGNARAALSVPSGWNVTGSGDLGKLGSRERTATFTVTPPAGASVGRAQISATLTSGRATGQTATMVNVQPPVTGQQQPLPRVDDFDTWATKTGVPALIGQMKRVLTVGSGKSRDVRVDLVNTTSSAQSGTVKLDLPKGFSADAASKPYTLAADAKGTATFKVTNTDASLPTSNQGGSGGDYDYTITTTPSSGPADVETAALELVPVAEIPKAAAAPKIDGKEETGEYTGAELNLSRVWEGDACASAADCSATGKVTWTDDALNVLVKVRDDKQGTVLGADDCKRHWRTDSVEIGIDPRGDSENTSTTFKTGIFPQMADGKPCFERDADAHQGGADAAPGMQVAATVNQPYDGYTVEAKIPFKDLPTAVDPARMGLNVFVYDSDTQDKTGQTRIGWSTWGGVQGDPYRWGQTTLPGYTPDPGLPTTPPAPVMPTDAAASVNSPQSIEQAVRTGIPLAGGPAAPRSDSARISGTPKVSGGSTTFRLRATGPGTAHVTVWDGKVLGTRTVEVKRAGPQSVTVTGASGLLAVAFEAKKGGTASSVARLTR